MDRGRKPGIAAPVLAWTFAALTVAVGIALLLLGGFPR